MSAVLSASALGKRYGRASALEGVSFEIGAGELVGVVGPNGAGKTTLLSIIAGVLDASAGSVRLSGGVASAGWVPQSPALYSKLSVAENLELFARLERVHDPDARVAAMLEQTGLAGRATERVVRLSGGSRQRVNVAVGLLADPPLLALDEPSASLDPDQRERLWAFLRARAAAGTAVLFSTHNVSEVQRHASRVLVLASGRLLYDGSVQGLLKAGGELAAGAAPAGTTGTTAPAGGDLERALVRFLRA